MLTRRSLLKSTAAVASVTAATRHSARAASGVVNDVTRLNPTEVTEIVQPHTAEEISGAVKNWPGAVCIGGGRYSMGGQIAAAQGLHLDMREFNQLIRLDVEGRVARVQSGMRWRDLLGIVDPHGLSPKVMQSYSNFTIGGALSVNAHGRYVGVGPVINSVRSFKIVLPGGSAVEANRQQAPELFRAAIGGYGGIGVITEVELDLVPNRRMERRVDYMPMTEYKTYFHEQVLGESRAIFHNANLEFPTFDRATCITWFETEKDVSVKQRLRPIGDASPTDIVSVWALSEFPSAQLIRRAVVEPLQFKSRPVIWRNHEASLDVASLGPIGSNRSTFALQEYFIPTDGLEAFAGEMARILAAGDANALNVSIRHSPQDTESILAWAQQEVFSFVLYYKQSTSADEQRHVGSWTRKLIDASLAMGGTYYLPYQLHATPDQFLRAYPRAETFFALKKQMDPTNQFRNKLWDKYAPKPG